MAHRPLMKGDRVVWRASGAHVFTGIATGSVRRNEVYVTFKTGGHWLTEDELELATLEREDIELLITAICTVDGQATGTSPPHPESKLGKVHAKLIAQLEDL